MKRLVVVADCHSGDHEFFKKLAGDQVELLCLDDSLHEVDPAQFKEAEVVAVHVSSRLSAELLKSMSKLKLVVCRSTGFDNVDMDQAKKQGVIVANVPAYGEATVAEYAALLMLALSRKLTASVEMAVTGYLDPAALIGSDLEHKTLGVVGTGRIGRHLIGIAKGFGMEVIAFDIKPNQEAAVKLGYKYVPLDEIWRDSDIISLHAPATDENHHLVNHEVLTQMKPSSLLINTARGGLVDTDALVRALADETIGGAALDVIEGEELLDLEQELHLLQSRPAKLNLQAGMNLDALQKMDNVIITTHNAYNTHEALRRIQEGSLANIKSYLDGKTGDITRVN